MADVQLLAVLVLVAFLPPIAYAVWLRNIERYEKEPWLQVGKMFLWGGIGGIVLGILFTVVLTIPFGGPGGATAVVGVAYVSTVFAPLAEEPAKALGLKWVRDPYPEPEDGLIYGAAAGLGFAATETLFYVASSYAEAGAFGLVVTGTLRAFSSAFLHATTTAMVGFGYLRHRRFGEALPWLAGAILVHAAYNGVLSATAFFGNVDPVTLGLVGLGLALVIAVGGIRWVRGKVHDLDRAGPGSV